MKQRFLAATARRRRGVLVAAVALAVAYLLVQARVPVLGQRAFPAVTALSVIFLLMTVVAATTSPPREFAVRPDVPAFAAPARPALVFLVLGALPMATGSAGNVIRDWGAEPFLPDQLLELGYAALVAALAVVTWRDRGVELRPDGVWQNGLVVPWEPEPRGPELPPAPTARTVRVRFGQPETVRRLRTDTVDPRFLVAAVRHYAANPADRAAIGTQAEYERRRPQLLDALDWSPR